jgi:hypothetical protein
MHRKPLLVGLFATLMSLRTVQICPSPPAKDKKKQKETLVLPAEVMKITAVTNRIV